MPGPDVQQLPDGGCLTSFYFCTCPLCFAWIFLSYLMPSHFIGILSLGPCILFYFIRCLNPPGTRLGSVNMMFPDVSCSQNLQFPWFHRSFSSKNSLGIPPSHATAAHPWPLGCWLHPPQWPRPPPGSSSHPCGRCRPHLASGFYDHGVV